MISASPSSSPSRRTEPTSVGTMSVRQHSKIWRLYLTFPPTSLRATSRRNVVPSHSSLRHYSKRSSDSGRRGHPKASLLCGQSSDGRPDEIYEDWEARFALFITTRKLKHYFQSFPVVVLTEYHLKAIVENLEANGRIAKWVTEIRPLRVTFEPKTAIKGQIMANFIAEFTPGRSPQNNSLKRWILNVERASNSKRAGVGVVLTNLDGSIIEQSYTLGFRATNNEAEYEAVIAGLKMATTLEVTEL